MLSQAEFLSRVRKAHGDRYDYSKAEYRGTKTPVTIICREHGEFEQQPVVHWQGHGCPECGGVKVQTEQTFIDKARRTHGDRYDYSSVKFKNMRTDVVITCREHGEFKQDPYTHIRGGGCSICNGVGRKTTDSFIEEARAVHGDRYDYSLVEYTNNRTPVKIICKEHGVFQQVPKSHLRGAGCMECYRNKQTKTKEEFIQDARKVHGYKYLYDNVDYSTGTNKISITCREHGDFLQLPNTHLNGCGCPICYRFNPVQEKKIAKFLRQYTKVIRNDRTILCGKEIDIVLPEHKLAIEYNGLHWHSSRFKDAKYHLEKTEMCEAKGYRLIHIFEDEWLNKQDIVKSRLMNLIGETEKRIYARQCTVREIDSSTASKFMDDNHLQGKVGASHRYGLFFKNELVSVMTFGGRRKSMGAVAKEGEFELLRFCNKKGYSVVGGASKLLKKFINSESPDEIMTYADRRWSDGSLYETLGFEALGTSKPNYFYVVNGTREHRFKYRKSELVKQGFDKNQTEREIMEGREIYRIYDCGTRKYVLHP